MVPVAGMVHRCASFLIAGLFVDSCIQQALNHILVSLDAGQDERSGGVTVSDVQIGFAFDESSESIGVLRTSVADKV